VLPLPGEWYDADYFEHGLKSNWEDGYTWPRFKGVFEESAAYLKEIFPEARTFLDMGCAKGYLVRALRDKGVEAWGFDHSPWALAHVETAARPFVIQADVLGAAYERRFDVLVAMSLLESLTEEQIRVFLPRARAWAQQAIYVTIPTLEAGASELRDDRDLSHVTLRDRDWWRSRFLEAGWKQDALHRSAERTFQAHPFPTKMGWSVYVFSPGE
jgi:cyclopropane fatty-acyl-phospholipid synthase-like methyltransferase